MLKQHILTDRFDYAKQRIWHGILELFRTGCKDFKAQKTTLELCFVARRDLLARTDFVNPFVYVGRWIV